MMVFRIQGLGLGVWVLGFRVQGLESRVYRAKGLRSEVAGFGLGVCGLGFRGTLK